MNTYLIDSSAWLEYFADGKNADFFAEPLYEKNCKIIVPAIIIYEVFKKILIERDEDTALEITAQLQQYQVENIDDNIAISAAKISYDYKLPFADSIIYATAKKYNAMIWTQDKDFQNLENVKYIAK